MTETLTAPIAAKSRANPLWKALLFFSSLLVGMICLWQISASNSASTSWTGYVTIILFLWTIIYVVATYNYFSTIYLFTSSYLLCLVAFHLGQVVVHTVGLDYLPHFLSGSRSILIQKASWASVFAVNCMGAGLALSMRSTLPERPGAGRKHSASESRTLGVAFWMGLGLSAAAVFGLILTTFTVGNIFAFTRNEVFGGIGDTRGFGLFLLAAPSAAVMLAIGARKRYEKLIALAAAIVIAGLLLLLGYRSSALFAGLVGAVVWIKVGKRIPIYVAIGSILFVSVAIPTVRVLREMGSLEDLSTNKIEQAFESTGSIEVIREIGGTNGLLADIMDWVPDEEPYWYGSSYIWAMSTFLPNFGRSADSKDDPLAGVGTSTGKLREGNPARWYIYKTNRYKYDLGLGSGFSAIAEPYLNFGYAGIVMYFVGLGFLLGRLDQVDLRQNPKTLIFSGALLWPLVKSVRNNVGVFIKPLGLMLVVLIVWRAFTFWKSNR